MATIKNIVQQNVASDMVKLAEERGRGLAKDELTTSQIRSVFGQVRQIEAMWRIPKQRAQAERLLLLLKPRMAYQAAKENRRGVNQLRDILTEAIDAVYEGAASNPSQLDERFPRFVEFFEALLAYYRAEAEDMKGRRS